MISIGNKNRVLEQEDYYCKHISERVSDVAQQKNSNAIKTS